MVESVNIHAQHSYSCLAPPPHVEPPVSIHLVINKKIKHINCKEFFSGVLGSSPKIKTLKYALYIFKNLKDAIHEISISHNICHSICLTLIDIYVKLYQ